MSDVRDDAADRAAALEPMLADADPRVRKSTVIALGRMSGEVATAMLARALDDDVEGVRVLACQALARKGDPGALPALVAHIHDASPEVRCGVVWAIGNVAVHGGLGADEVRTLVNPIMVAAFDPADAVRADAAAVLGTLGEAVDVEALEVLTEDDCARVRANAYSSLGFCPQERALELLHEALTGPGHEPLEQVSALTALVDQAARGHLSAGEPLSVALQRVVCELARRPMADDPASSLSYYRGAFRGTASMAAGQAGSVDHGPGGAGEAQGSPAVPNATEDGGTVIGAACAPTAGDGGAPASAHHQGGSELLTQERQASMGDVRATALWALGAMPACPGEQTDRAHAILFDALEDPDPWCARYALGSLAALGTVEAREALADLKADLDAGEVTLDPEVVQVLESLLA